MKKRILAISCLLGIVLLASCSQAESTDAETELFAPEGGEEEVIEEPGG